MVSSRFFPRTRSKQVTPNATGNSKVFVVTDASTRTGIAAARAAAELGAGGSTHQVVILDTKAALAAGAVQSLKKAVPGGNFRGVECDLSDFESVGRAIHEVRSTYGSAGVYCLATGAGADGYAPEEELEHDSPEVKMQLSRILLATELLPLLEAQALKTGEARVINHSGIAYRSAMKRFRENGDVLGGDGTKRTEEGVAEGDLSPYLAPKVARSARRSSTAFKMKRDRPGTPVLVLSQFVRIKAKTVSSRKCSSADAGSCESSTRLVYSGIY